MTGLTVDIMHESVIEELIEVCPEFSSLKNIDIKHTKRREWKRGNKTTFDIQIIFVGKTGYGKSTTVNKLTQKNIFGISDNQACTKKCQCIDYALSKENPHHYFSLGDLPGLGESVYADDDYLKMYSEFLSKADVAVYVLRADSRDYAIDERAFSKLFRNVKTRERVIIALNCADKVEPINRSYPFLPNEAQLRNINCKIKSVSRIFNIPTSRIVAYSALESWNTQHLVKIICSRLNEILVINSQLTSKSRVPMFGNLPFLDRRR